MLLGKNRRELLILIVPEKMKWLGQSRNYAHLWMCLVVKGKSNPINNNIS